MGIATENIIGGGPPTATIEQAQRYLLDTPGCLLTETEAWAIAEAFRHWGGLVGIAWDRPFAQSCHETRCYLFGNQVALVQHNPAGIGATNDGSPGLTFATWDEGIRAMLIHLLAWTDRLDLARLIHRVPTDLDPRIPIVAQVRAEKGKATTWASLANRWAVPGVGYAAGLERHHSAILSVSQPPSATQGGTMPPKPPMQLLPSPNRGYNNGHTRRVDALLWHITAGTDSRGWLTDPASNASANYLVRRDGIIYELVPHTESAWANGQVNKPNRNHPLIAKWLTEIKNGTVVNFNQRVNSIEFEGFSSKGQGGSLTAAQIASGIALSAWLCGEDNIAPDRLHIFGHNQIDSVDRPNCPGFSEAEWNGWVGRVAALVNPPPPAPSGMMEPVVTERTVWGGAGKLISEEVTVQNIDTGEYFSRKKKHEAASVVLEDWRVV